VTDYIGSTSSAKLDITEEESFNHDISDTRSKLAMIDDILSQQEEVIDRVIQWSSFDWKKKLSFQTVKKARHQLGKLRRRVDKINKNAERIEKTI
jgi:hypothetical protein